MVRKTFTDSLKALGGIHEERKYTRHRDYSARVQNNTLPAHYEYSGPIGPFFEGLDLACQPPPAMARSKQTARKLVGGAKVRCFGDSRRV